MNDKLLSALSLCRKAGGLKTGFEASVEACASGAPLLLLAADAGENTRSRAEYKCPHTEIINLPYSGAELERALGRKYAVAAVTDADLARLVKKSIGDAEVQYAD